MNWNQCHYFSFGIRINIDDVNPHVKELGNKLNAMHHGMVLNFAFDNWGQSCRHALKYCIQTIAVHEFGHALGFAHEQNRPDTPSDCDLDQGSSGDWMIGAWDLDSVMNYCNPRWSGDGWLSMTDIEGAHQTYGWPFAQQLSMGPWAVRQGGFWNEQKWLAGDFNGDGRDDLAKVIGEYGLATIDVYRP